MYRYNLKNRYMLYKLYVDHQFKLNSDLKAIVKMTRLNISPELYANSKLPSTFMPVEQSFSRLHKRLVKIFPR